MLVLLFICLARSYFGLCSLTSVLLFPFVVSFLVFLFCLSFTFLQPASQPSCCPSLHSPLPVFSLSCSHCSLISSSSSSVILNSLLRVYSFCCHSSHWLPPWNCLFFVPFRCSLYCDLFDMFFFSWKLQIMIIPSYCLQVGPALNPQNTVTRECKNICPLSSCLLSFCLTLQEFSA